MKQASNSHVIYIPHPDATQEAELNALASVYMFILKCRAKENTAGVTSTNGDDAKGSQHDRARQKYTG